MKSSYCLIVQKKRYAPSVSTSDLSHGFQIVESPRNIDFFVPDFHSVVAQESRMVNADQIRRDPKPPQIGLSATIIGENTGKSWVGIAPATTVNSALKGRRCIIKEVNYHSKKALVEIPTRPNVWIPFYLLRELFVIVRIIRLLFIYLCHSPSFQPIEWNADKFLKDMRQREPSPSPRPSTPVRPSTPMPEPSAIESDGSAWDPGSRTPGRYNFLGRLHLELSCL